jgi:predicted DNA-binding transcriptional regulator AlpA
MSTEQLISREQVIRRMGISDSTERRMRNGGQSWPAHVRVGHRVLYRESAVSEWVAAQESITADSANATGR